MHPLLSLLSIFESIKLFQTTANNLLKPIIEKACAYLANPYYPDASSPWLDPELSQLDEKLRNLLIGPNLQRIGAGLGLGLGWEEEMAVIIMSGELTQALHFTLV